MQIARQHINRHDDEERMITVPRRLASIQKSSQWSTKNSRSETLAKLRNPTMTSVMITMIRNDKATTHHKNIHIINANVTIPNVFFWPQLFPFSRFCECICVIQEFPTIFIVLPFMHGNGKLHPIRTYIGPTRWQFRTIFLLLNEERGKY